MSPSAIREPLTLDSLIDYVAQEQDATRAEYDALMALPVQDRVRRGYTLTDLRVGAAGRDADQVWLETGEQLSRSLRGDEVLLVAEDAQTSLYAGVPTNGAKISAQVLEVQSSRLLVLPARTLDPGRTWRMEPTYANHAAVVAKALTCIDAYHGQHLLDALNGAPAASNDEGLSDPEGLLTELEAECEMTLDADQRAAFCAATQTPTLWGVQGPPGTGKTRVAAFVAEALARGLLHRVVVVSQSHEAVNRLLNEVAKLFPERKLIKVGAVLRPTPDAAVQRLTHQDFHKDEKRLLRSRPILGMTLHTALLMADLYGFRADVIIVDEASQVPLAYGAALGLLGFSVLLFGDPAQLNAIVPPALEDSALACSLLERCAVMRDLAFLPITYRLNAPLAELVGSLFYPDANGQSRLVAGPGIGERRLRFLAKGEDAWAEAVLDPQKPAVWVCTNEEGRRRSSRLEAQLIARLVKRLLASGVKGQDIAGVTPFRQQVQLLGAELASVSQRVRIGTVETMQGQSVEVVIVSLASSEPEYLATVADFYFSPNRWNVAFSRARTKLIIVGSDVVVEAFPPAMLVGQCANNLTTGLQRMPRVRWSS